MRARPGIMLVLSLLLVVCTGVRARDFNVTYFALPRFVTAGLIDVIGECGYDANFTFLSWYKGSQEFFRYRPGKTPSTRSFPVPGIGSIEMLFCGPEACKLRLGDLTEEATDLYRCDIERDVPPYQYSTMSAHMEVHSPERRKPLLEGIAEEYKQGDLIQAYCRGGHNSELRWYINGREVPDSTNLTYLKTESSWYLFTGNPPTVVVQCAEFRKGKMIGSTQKKARWNGVSCNSHKAETKMRNKSNVITGCSSWMSIFLYLLNIQYYV